MRDGLSEIPLDGEVLVDLGCGDGAILDRTASSFQVAIGIDIRRPNEVRSRHGWQFVQADLDVRFPLDSGVADIVHANQVIEHVSNPLHFAIEAERVLRPGGIFVVATPNVRYIKHLWALAIRGSGPMTSREKSRTAINWDAGHLHAFTPGDLRWIARGAGFATFRTRALTEREGRLRLVRQMLDRASSNSIITEFVSGNTLLIARKADEKPYPPTSRGEK